MSVPENGFASRVAHLERRSDDHASRLNGIEKKMAVEEIHRMNVESRLGSIEDLLKWLVRTVMGAILLAAVAFALSGGLKL